MPQNVSDEAKAPPAPHREEGHARPAAAGAPMRVYLAAPPNRKPLYIGAGVVVLGVLVLCVALSISGGRDKPGNQAASIPSIPSIPSIASTPSGPALLKNEAARLEVERQKQAAVKRRADEERRRLEEAWLAAQDAKKNPPAEKQPVQVAVPAQAKAAKVAQPGPNADELPGYKEALQQAWPNVKFNLQSRPFGLQLDLTNTAVSDLSAIRGMKLASLNLESTQVTDLSPLEGMPLSDLDIFKTKVTELSLLRELPLKSITLNYVPEQHAALLRSMKTLEKINGVPVADFWNCDTTSQVRSYVGPGSGVGHFVGDVAFLPDGQRVLTGNGDSKLRLWDTQSGKIIREFTGHAKFVWGVAVSSDGKRCLSSSADKTWRLWDLESGKEIRRANKLPDEVNQLFFTAGDKQAFTAGSEGTVRLWDLETAQELRHYDGHTKKVWGVALAPDGKSVYSTSEDGTVLSWDCETAEALFRFDAKSPVHAINFSKDGKQALIGCGDNTARLLDLDKRAEIRRFTGHTKQVWAAVFSPDGKSVLTSSDDTSLRLWDVASGKQLRRFQLHTDRVTGVAFTPDGRFAVSGSMDNSLRLWTMPGPEPKAPAAR